MFHPRGIEPPLTKPRRARLPHRQGPLLGDEVGADPPIQLLQLWGVVGIARHLMQRGLDGCADGAERAVGYAIPWDAFDPKETHRELRVVCRQKQATDPRRPSLEIAGPTVHETAIE